MCQETIKRHWTSSAIKSQESEQNFKRSHLFDRKHKHQINVQQVGEYLTKHKTCWIKSFKTQGLLLVTSIDYKTKKEALGFWNLHISVPLLLKYE